MVRGICGEKRRTILSLWVAEEACDLCVVSHLCIYISLHFPILNIVEICAR